jgi:hypothetical protein
MEQEYCVDTDFTIRPSIAMSNFAIKRHKKGTGHSYFNGHQETFLYMVRSAWPARVPGQGETDLSRKVVVPLNASKMALTYFPKFRGNSTKIQKGMKIKAGIGQRQEGEDLFISTRLKKSWFRRIIEKITGNDGLIPPEYVSVVCYSREALLENGGEVSSDAEWEVVALICSDTEKEPMRPLTMARNMLEKSGGTKSTYTAEEFAESIYYWSQRVSMES